MTAEEIFEELLSMTKYNRGLSFTVGRRLWNRKKAAIYFIYFL